MKPVYMLNGFLESGKTEFIIYTLSQSYFEIKGKTLLILCEEGESEYEESLLESTNTVIELVEQEEDFIPAKLIELEKKHKPERIIIEYNGMWNYINMKLPWHWNIQQQITTIDATTFTTYFSNMKSLLAEMIRKSELVLFNRCDGTMDLSQYRRSIKSINQKAEVVFEDENGEIEELLEEDLPYDLKSDLIILKDNTYGIWYLDMLDHIERYLGKKIQFVGTVLQPKEFPKGYFVPGRMAMTCCADDMTFLGFACEYDKADTLLPKQWVNVTVEIRKEYFAAYKGEGPVLKAIQVESVKPPKEEIISFM